MADCVSSCPSVCAAAPMEFSQLTLFFAQVLGVYLFLVCLSMLMRHQNHKKIMTDLLGDSTLLALTGALSILVGLTIIVSHNLWIYEWPVLITITGWVCFLKGAFRVLFPEAFVKFVKDMMNKTSYLVWCWFWFIVGIYLMWVGFGFSH